jgi:hypothetical protein
MPNTGARFNATEIQNSLFEFYLPSFRQNIKDPDKHYFMNQMEQNNYQSMSGKYAVYGLKKGVQGGAGSISDIADYKNPSTAGVAQQKVYTRNLTASCLIDLKTIAQGDNRGAFEDLLSSEMADMLISAKNDKARQMFTSQTGVITTVATALTDEDFTASGGVDVVVDNVQRFSIGMRVDILDVSGSYAVLADELEVVNIDKTNKKIYLQSTDYTAKTVTLISVAEDDVIVNADAYNVEISGLEDALTTGNTYHGINRTTNHWYNPQVNSISTYLSEQHLREAKDEVDINGMGIVNLVVARHQVVRGYESELTALKRFGEVGNSKTIAGGYKALLHDEDPFVKDYYSTASVVYGINKPTWDKLVSKEWDFDDFDGNLFKQTSGPRYKLNMIEFSNITTHNPRSNFIISGVTEGWNAS